MINSIVINTVFRSPVKITREMFDDSFLLILYIAEKIHGIKITEDADTMWNRLTGKETEKG